MESQAAPSSKLIRVLLVISCFLLVGGSCAGSLVIRLYFIHGGKRLWLTSWLQTSGCPIMFIPLGISYLQRRKSQKADSNKLFLMKPYLILASAIIGLIFGTISYLYSFGSSKLPVSTLSLIYASQLAFTAGFAFVIVKQKFTPYSINTIVLLTVGPAVLALNANSDRPEGESTKSYILGFVMVGLAAIANGVALPLMELAYKKANQAISYTLTMEFNFVMCLSATCFSTLGMLINQDFKALAREAKEFDLGEVYYYGVLVSTAISWQCSLLGLNGVIFCGSSLLSGIISAINIPLIELAAVIVFHEKFQAQKGVSLVLSLWGFVSYFYGEIKTSRKLKKSPELVLDQLPIQK